MERLQAAIEKARKGSPGGGQRGQKHQSLQEKWNALEPLSLSAPTLKKNLIFAHEATHEAVSFDILRTRTLRFMQQRGWTRVAVTSPSPACGKSTVSLNLAFAMARQQNTHTIQIELDMRQPSQERLLGLAKRNTTTTSSNDLEELLSGETPFSQVARRHGDRLALATNGNAVSNASDLLLGPQVGDVLQKIEDEYKPDIMIFDMPPMLANDDMIAFTQHVDCVLLIAAAENTTLEQIERCERDLAEQTNVLGVVLNKCRVTPADGRYGYNYSYGT
ncbi:tyrosine-protein kinase family protein [Celeribacter neptunius]|uniref:Chromosome partitioning ATPase, Mrp family, contains Fe-S cluster n=1 Tax=Celeribacter neptunius TaxID=588602 RepID=A0A1I3SDL4_9RHOB|nr:CpsD/CapB family tyrosine-protein kinase [Celeribacter neptunius]SFJ56042.1 Chromosome partitioning ATPase, Mrp family, contains Fe-S cluster [Celeribacter neptunius]